MSADPEEHGHTSPVPGLPDGPVTAVERWRNIPRRWKAILVALAVLTGLSLTESTFSGLGGSGSNGASGPSSTFDTTSSGTAAFAQLLSQRGHPVDRATLPLDRISVSGAAAVFVLDPASISAGTATSLARLLERGSTVVLGGPSSFGVLRTLIGARAVPSYRSAGITGVVPAVGAGPELVGVRQVAVLDAGAFSLTPRAPTGTRALLGAPNSVVAVAMPVAAGRVVLLASSSSLSNGLLTQADNAAFGLNLAGGARTPVIFDEYDHGFGRAGLGLGGLPLAWRIGLLLALLAVLIWMLSAARRFGPPARRDRTLIPPRVAYVDAMATALSAARPEQLFDGAEPVRAEARRLLCRRLGVPREVTDDVLAAALSDAGTRVPDGVADAVTHPIRSSTDVMAVGRALALLQDEGMNR